jgi:oligopeptide/dipeptide ABC transporter ATP-binding protein
MADRLLEVDGLKTYFHTHEGVVKAVDDVSFHIEKGETLGVVGESGCGKSVSALSVMQLIPPPRGVIEGGTIRYQSESGEVDITSLRPKGQDMRAIRGNEIAMIFQEPMTSLNPVYTVGEQIMEAVRLHQGADDKLARQRAVEMLDRVNIARPDQTVDGYPHQLSGGMRQRIMIAMALSCDPNLLIADEPTTALDVTIEAQILELIDHLQDEFGMSVMFITHDLDVIGEISERVMVMYTGKVVERANTEQLFYNPAHPYTQALLKSIPKIGRHEKLEPITGSVPNLLSLPRGCYFAPRCPYAMDVCRRKEPPMFKVEEGHHAKCWLHEKDAEATEE